MANPDADPNTVIARWLVDEINQHGPHTLPDLSRKIAERFGPGFTWTNDSGGIEIVEPVMARFEELAQQDGLRYFSGETAWRRPTEADEIPPIRPGIDPR